MKSILEVPPFSWWCQHRARKHGREVAKHVRRLLATHRDIMESDKVKAAEKALAEFDSVRRGTIDEIEQGMDRLDKACAKLFPTPKHAQWREVIEIGLVAAVVAWGGIRTFFVQPFKIPTGSMQPTLFGVHIEPLGPDEKVPMLPQRLLEMALFGRTYIDVKCEEDGELGLTTRYKHRIGPFEWPFEKTVLMVGTREYFLSVDLGSFGKAELALGLHPGRAFHRGEQIVRCVVSNGDHIFVDKVSYNFRRPRRGEVFVFETRDILAIDQRTGGEFYIKRLAAVGGDKLRIEEPKFFINGQLAKEAGFTRVMSLTNSYHGYTNPVGAQYLRHSDDTFTVEKNHYFALGDNSRNSADSRYFGMVPHENLVGKALFLYWPLSRRFGLTN